MQGMQTMQLLTHPAADLDQAEAQRVELHARAAGPYQGAAQCIEQPVGGRVQQQTKLVGPEAMAAEAVGKAGALEILDPELRLAPLHLPIGERERVQIGAAGHQEAEIASFLEFLR